jgi:hypothetical protein
MSTLCTARNESYTGQIAAVRPGRGFQIWLLKEKPTLKDRPVRLTPRTIQGTFRCNTQSPKIFTVQQQRAQQTQAPTALS